ncbi:hypothetical protein KHS38_06730 [Mucilaginibacter sp. Bleaf8]|uniref:hypothetical protein n=1 Tax=Mucilaginibacter sp. Bleaf8 TaxID=2834430 RepID=UPI001BCD9983|nr:hypothetical protein [Mucilaginibacter sp. Bleaf8]MBS7564097.1 hypothetical protein [Mucilaginibacter sp. Bleaf8]
MINRALLLSAVALLCAGQMRAQITKKAPADKSKTSFQSADGWDASYDIRSDVAMVYGINDAGGNFEGRVKSWRDHGYNVQFMTGIAWGQYQDYFTGKFDGKTHWEDSQVQMNGDTIWHGKWVPYVVPSPSYLTYIKSHVKRAIDAGVTAIYLEEPEYWARAGYSESFKKEWAKYYSSAWMPQHESPEATYLSSKLKYHLYYNALKDVFQYAKSYSRSIGKEVKCYVPTHSLINYSSWDIVSPEASLANLPDMDGYIAQIWTGTSRSAIYYNGVKKERVFENAFLEYGSMISMTAPTGRKMYLLTDPIEDRPQTWNDYKRNYQATFTAELLYPTVGNYEVMPWPGRIYNGKFKLEGSTERVPISPAYATQMQVMINSLNSMPVSANKVNGSQGIAVLVGNSMMFQRFPLHKGYDDPLLSNFYGMALPLLKRGVPVQTVHMENLSSPGSLSGIKVLIMSYSNMKPLSAEVHSKLADWVKQGGTLIYYGRDNDPFQSVKEWWNSGANHYQAPAEHLFKLLHVAESSKQSTHTYGKGRIEIVRQDPKELVLKAGQDADYLARIAKAYEQYAHAGKLQQKNYFMLQRGPYTIASVLDESSSTTPLQIKGPVIDLFDPQLPVLTQKVVQPGEQAFLYNLKQVHNPAKPAVLAAAARVYRESNTTNSYSFLAKSPANTHNVMRILLPRKPLSVKASVEGKQLTTGLDYKWDAASNTCLVQFENNSNGVNVKITW